MCETGPHGAEIDALQLVDELRGGYSICGTVAAGTQGSSESTSIPSTDSLPRLAHHYARMPSLLREAIESSFPARSGGGPFARSRCVPKDFPHHRHQLPGRQRKQF